MIMWPVGRPQYFFLFLPFYFLSFFLYFFWGGGGGEILSIFGRKEKIEKKNPQSPFLKGAVSRAGNQRKVHRH